MQGWCYEFEGGGEVNTVKALKFEKVGRCITPPPTTSYGGAAPVCMSY